ncbi:MAG: hypothetical protein CMJ24_10490 [Phycisphaerae bacterium]|nr:hypothetical protein [Phycisphaerae bacterium]
MQNRCASFLLCLTGLLTFNGELSAAPPTSLTSVATETTLDDAQKKRIKEYTVYWLDMLKTGTPEQATRARNKLVEPVRSMLGSSSSLFRSTYSGDVIPTLQKIVEGDDLFRAVNALQITGFLGSDRAMRLLVETEDPDVEASPEKRLWATIAIREALKNGDLSPRKVSSTVRSVARAASTEKDWRVLMREMETLAAASQSSIPRDQGGDEIRDLGRKLQLEVITNTINRLSSGDGKNIDLIYALRPSILELRQQYLDPSMIEYRRELGLGAALQLGRVYEVVLVNYDSLRSDPELMESSGLTLRLSEETLKLIDTDIRNGGTPTSSSVDAWEQGRRDVVQKNKAEWESVLGKPPYSGR